MKKLIIPIFILVVPFLLFSQDKDPVKFKWSNGFQFESPDKQHKIKFGGRIMYDAAFFSNDEELDGAFEDLSSGLEFRRGRFFSSGQVYNRVKYKIQLDFTGGDVVFKDVYIQLTKIPIAGNIRAGHFKEPFRLEALTSSKYITFMERSQHVPFSPERNTGILIYDQLKNKRVGWQLGFFGNGDKQGNDKMANGGYNLTGRLTGLLLDDQEKNQLVHVGVGVSHRMPSTNEYKVSTRPESHLAPKLVSTGTIEDVEDITLFNAEAAFVSGPFSFQGEFLQANVNQEGEESMEYAFNAYYGQASYFITGESRKYKDSYSGFNRIKPKSNFGDGEGGLGAWEVALRYSTIDLEDEDIMGGQLNDISLGVNWYLNPATRIMTNYVLADLKVNDMDVGKAHIGQMRFQIDF